MTTDELKLLADIIVNNISEVPEDNFGEIAEYIFDGIYEGKTPEEREIINSQLLNVGIDFTGICKKKHPRPTT